MKKLISLLPALFLSLLLFSCNQNHRQSSQELTNTQADSVKKINCDSLLKQIGELKADTFGHVTRIPNNFQECLFQLDTLINERLKEWIKCLPDGDFSGYVHHGFGMYLRNNWGLWAHSKLTDNLYKMGILHPDDMTAIILDSYQRKLKGEDIRLQEQLKHYQEYWRNTGMPVDSILNSLEKQ